MKHLNLIAGVLPSVFVSSIDVGVTAGDLAMALTIGVDSRGSLSLLVILSFLRSLMWCLTIISSNVFRGEFWTCNCKEKVSCRLVCLSLYACTAAADVQLQDIPYSFYRDPPCWVSASGGICCWYWPLCVDAPHPYRQSSSSVPAD